MQSLVKQLAQQLNLSIKQVSATVELLEGGATIPFIARYRKERTGSLNEVQLVAIRDGMARIKELEKRREAIITSIKEQEKLTPALLQQLQKATSLTELEDIYLPFKPKRRTKAAIARERGLEPLAKNLLKQSSVPITRLARQYVKAAKGVENEEMALEGARHIIAEWVNENVLARNRIRYTFERKATVKAKVIKTKKEEAEKYQDYFDYEESINRIPSYRFLAIQRGVNEGFLRMNIEPDIDLCLEHLERIFVRGYHESSEQVATAIKDAYKRLMKPSIETEFRNLLKEKADKEAIHIFSINLRKLLLAAPLGQKNVLAIDPGFRTGCKVVCLNKQGDFLHYTTIFPFDRSAMKRYEAMSAIENLCKTYTIEAIAIGNGTAGRETLQFLKKVNLPDENTSMVMVNESGASIYSVSEVARKEFPKQDATVRGAISIGRRLMDPLAELVKVDPKSIGVGQYQHDVDQKDLKQSLDDTVISCVNKVGVTINTASKELLAYVSGVGNKVAENIVTYRQEVGEFSTKMELKKVKGLGPKAFEQAAGFIRIDNAANPLDASAIHPESYTIVKKMAKDLNVTVRELIDNPSLREQIVLDNYVVTGEKAIGLPTLIDIKKELAKPGRDPRESFTSFQFSEEINTIEDLSVGMILDGEITNVTNFGAFVNIGIKENGLVHKSQLANRYISDPTQVVSVQQRVKVKIIALDLDRKRIQLSMKATIDK